MKKIFVIIILVMFGLTIYSQQDSETSSISKRLYSDKNKDRFLIGMHHSFWNGLPGGVSAKGLCQGYNLALMFDFPTSENSQISFGLGLGYTSYNLYSNATISLNAANNRTTEFTIIPSNIKYNINKLKFNYLNIPLELRLRTIYDIRFAVGLRSGMIVEAHSKYYGHSLDGLDNQLKIIDKDISNKEKYLFEITARAGWKFVSLNAAFSLNKMFVEDKGPQIYPYSVGVGFSIW